MTGTRLVPVIFFALACVLTFAAPEAVHSDALGDPGPALLPRIVGVCMGLLAVLLFLQDPGEAASDREPIENPLIISLSLLAFPAFYLMFQTLGYTIAVALYLAVAFYLLGLHNRDAIFRYLLVAVAFSLSSGMVFARLLDLPLPGVLP